MFTVEARYELGPMVKGHSIIFVQLQIKFMQTQVPMLQYDDGLCCVAIPVGLELQNLRELYKELLGSSKSTHKSQNS